MIIRFSLSRLASRMQAMMRFMMFMA